MSEGDFANNFDEALKNLNFFEWMQNVPTPEELDLSAGSTANESYTNPSDSAMNDLLGSLDEGLSYEEAYDPIFAEAKKQYYLNKNGLGFLGTFNDDSVITSEDGSPTKGYDFTTLRGANSDAFNRAFNQEYGVDFNPYDSSQYQQAADFVNGLKSGEWINNYYDNIDQTDPEQVAYLNEAKKLANSTMDTWNKDKTERIQSNMGNQFNEDIDARAAEILAGAGIEGYGLWSNFQTNSLGLSDDEWKEQWRTAMQSPEIRRIMNTVVSSYIGDDGVWGDDDFERYWGDRRTIGDLTSDANGNSENTYDDAIMRARAIGSMAGAGRYYADRFRDSSLRGTLQPADSEGNATEKSKDFYLKDILDQSGGGEDIESALYNSIRDSLYADELIRSRGQLAGNTDWLHEVGDTLAGRGLENPYIYTKEDENKPDNTTAVNVIKDIEESFKKKHNDNTYDFTNKDTNYGDFASLQVSENQNGEAVADQIGANKYQLTGLINAANNNAGRFTYLSDQKGWY